MQTGVTLRCITLKIWTRNTASIRSAFAKSAFALSSSDSGIPHDIDIRHLHTTTRAVCLATTQHETHSRAQDLSPQLFTTTTMAWPDHPARQVTFVRNTMRLGFGRNPRQTGCTCRVRLMNSFGLDATCSNMKWSRFTKLLNVYMKWRLNKQLHWLMRQWLLENAQTLAPSKSVSLEHPAHGRLLELQHTLTCEIHDWSFSQH